MRILAILTLAAVAIGFVSCAKDKPAPATTTSSYEGKTVKHVH